MGLALFACVWGCLLVAQAGGDELWVAKPLTKTGEFTPGIEGPATAASGAIYAVNFAQQGTIGRVTPEGKGEVYVTLPEGSVGNGIRFDRAGWVVRAVELPLDRIPRANATRFWGGTGCSRSWYHTGRPGSGENPGTDVLPAV